MRYYFFGDIHGNFYALQRCLEHLQEVAADKAYCLGDVVGWLPFGDRTLLTMQASQIATVAGNHDLMVAGLFPDHPHQLDRIQATAYNAGLLSQLPGTLEYLLALPWSIEEDEFAVVHHSPFSLPSGSAPISIDCFNYLTETELSASLKAWQACPWRIIFSGHDHLPAVYELPDLNHLPKPEEVSAYYPSPSGHLTIKLKPQCRYWVKAGSVGGPYRDKVAVGNSVLYDSAAQTLTLFRLPYPTAALREALLANRFFQNLPAMHRFVELLE